MSSKTELTPQNILPVQLKAEKGIEVKAAIAVVLGLAVYLGAISFGGVGLLKSYHAFSWPDAKLPWLVSAINTLGNKKIWGILVGGGILGGVLMGFGICKLYHNHSTTKNIPNLTNSNEAPVSAALEEDKTLLSEAELKQMFKLSPEKATGSSYYQQPSDAHKEGVTWEEFGEEHSSQKRYFTWADWNSSQVVIGVAFDDGSIGCISCCEFDKQKIEEYENILKENGYSL